MKLIIEKWLIDQRVGFAPMQLFDESIKAYKASAYKASLLFSYLGFMTILKERILVAAKPPGITDSDWIGIQNWVRNTEVWDSKVFEATQKQNPSPIFLVTDTLRREIIYWKDRRNDCAHFKHEKIDYHHVESFWSFLENNLGKFAVNGGIPALIGKFKNYFDISITPPGTNMDNIIGEIASTVDASTITSFYQSLDQEIQDIIESTHFKVYDQILAVYSSYISDELISFLKSDRSKLIWFLREYPNRLQIIQPTAEFIRSLWYTNLFENGNDFELYSAILSNNLIPADQLDEAHNHILTKRHAKTSIPNAIQSAILERTGFYVVLKSLVFPAGGFASFAVGNSYSILLSHYLAKFDIDELMARSLCNTFSTLYTPNDLERKLNTFFNSELSKKAAFNAILSINNITAPVKILDIVS